jgi:hypothetical protein
VGILIILEKMILLFLRILPKNMDLVLAVNFMCILSIVTDILSFYVGKIDVAITYKSIIAMFLISSMLIISVLIGVIKKYVLKVNLIERVISY